MSKLRAILMNCTLKRSGERSSTDAMLAEVAKVFRDKDVHWSTLRMVNENIPFGVQTDMGDGDPWPAIHKKILDSNIILIGTPIWLGNRGSVCQMVLERMDAMFSETNEQGQLPLYNKVGGVCVVGNEDGAQHVGAGVLYNLMQMGCTIPPNAEAYWVGPAGGRDDYVDVGMDHEYTKIMIRTLGHNLVHLATMLRERPVPVDGNKSG